MSGKHDYLDGTATRQEIWKAMTEQEREFLTALRKRFNSRVVSGTLKRRKQAET